MTKAQVRFKNTVTQLINKNVYPSADNINKALGRRKSRYNGLSGRECIWRRQICFDIGFKLKGVNQLNKDGTKFEFGIWYTPARMGSGKI